MMRTQTGLSRESARFQARLASSSSSSSSSSCPAAPGWIDAYRP
jgi:hypothetical protein